MPKAKGEGYGRLDLAKTVPDLTALPQSIGSLANWMLSYMMVRGLWPSIRGVAFAQYGQGGGCWEYNFLTSCQRPLRPSSTPILPSRPSATYFNQAHIPSTSKATARRRRKRRRRQVCNRVGLNHICLPQGNFLSIFILPKHFISFLSALFSQFQQLLVFSSLQKVS